MPTVAKVKLLSKVLEINLAVNKIKSFGKLKEFIEENHEIPKEVQKIYQDEQLKTDTDIIKGEDEVVLYLVLSKVSPFTAVVYGYKFVEMEIRKTDSVEELKKRFEEIFGIPCNQQEIEIPDRVIEFDENDKPLFTYGITNKVDKIIVRRKLDVTIHLKSDKSKDCQIKVFEKNETVADLVNKIKKFHSIRMFMPSLRYVCDDKNTDIPKGTKLLELNNQKLHLIV